MQYGLIGEHLSHSISGAIHRYLTGKPYLHKELSPQEFPAFMEKRDFNGINITIPYKRAVIPYLDTLSDVAARTGSVNTVVKTANGRLHGHNTDYNGFIRAAQSAGLCFRGKKVLVLGSGGTSQTVCAAASDLGASSVVVVSRKGPVDYEKMYMHTDAGILINTTPVGMYPETGACPADLKRFPALSGVFDVIYNPLKTPLLCAAEDLGIPFSNGLRMLIEQARMADALFFSISVPDERVEHLCTQLTRRRQNIVLIGMPGSGKTTVGRLLAERLNRSFSDTDQMVEARAGCAIPVIFETQGESTFREMETQVIRSLGKESGRVISTGGGAVLSEENRLCLRQNGYFVLLERDLSALPLSGRPLSGDPCALARLYRDRQPVYKALHDFAVNNNRTADACVSSILEVLS